MPSPDLKQAKKDLFNNHEIVIKQADKGGAMVVWDREAYIREGLRQLADTMFYREQDLDSTISFNMLITNTLKGISDMGEIDQDVLGMLITEQPRMLELYLLPKIHKGKTPCPGRPVVSGNGSPTEKILAFIDLFLGPIVPKIRSYIKDTSHVLQIVSSLGTISEGTILASLDVSSLYTNIPNHEGRVAVKSFLSTHRAFGDVRGRFVSNHTISRLLELVLEKNNFSFNGRHYLQVGGTAMGTRVAPTYANIFMDKFEMDHVYTYCYNRGCGAGILMMLLSCGTTEKRNMQNLCNT